jgi:hypothetical protein
MTEEISRLSTSMPIVLDERGMVVLNDPELLELVTGACENPPPPPPPGNSQCNNTLCGGKDTLCIPIVVLCGPKPKPR